jgi:hypothetical protein
MGPRPSWARIAGSEKPGLDINLTGVDGKKIDQFLRGTGDSEKEDAVPEPPANPVTTG